MYHLIDLDEPLQHLKIKNNNVDEVICNSK